MKTQWYWPDVPSLLGTGLDSMTQLYSPGCGSHVLRTRAPCWNVVRLDFNEQDAEGDVLRMMRVLRDAAEIRVADFKEKHGVAV